MSDLESRKLPRPPRYRLTDRQIMYPLKEIMQHAAFRPFFGFLALNFWLFLAYLLKRLLKTKNLLASFRKIAYPAPPPFSCIRFCSLLPVSFSLRSESFAPTALSFPWPGPSPGRFRPNHWNDHRSAPPPGLHEWGNGPRIDRLPKPGQEDSSESSEGTE